METCDLRFRFECLNRTRVAKHEVLSRVLRRKISDGKWFDLGGYVRMDRDKIAPGISKLQSLRRRLSEAGIEEDEGKCAFLNHFPDVEIGYDERKQNHFLIL